MNKKILVILILVLLIFVVSSTILIAVNNKNTKTNKIIQDDTSYNEVYLNNDAMNNPNNARTENELDLNKNDKEESSKVKNIKIKVNNNVLNVRNVFVFERIRAIIYIKIIFAKKGLIFLYL